MHRGIGFSHPESVGGFLRLRLAAPKTGRPRHEKADEHEQEGSKKSSPERVEKESGKHSGKPVTVLAFDEARFGLMNRRGRRYRPMWFPRLES